MAKLLDTTEYVEALLSLTDEGQQVSLQIAGGSMLPFLSDCRAEGPDAVLIEKPAEDPGVGDIVLYRRDNGQYVLHRVHHITPAGYFIIGDAQVQLEGPIRRNQIRAVAVGANRKGCCIGPQNLIWRFFAHVWLHMIPLRKPAERLAGPIFRACRRK